ncbi:MAG: glycogen synthase [Fimbriimonadaceae bacterium]|nr:glycogen synthase [Fimbriimonadaceae bacterium]
MLTKASPNYAREITTPEFGCRLEGLMAHLYETNRLRGILNGIDVHEHNPMKDPQIAFPFSTEDLSGKAKTKEALSRELNLGIKPEEPLFSVISRLSNQKGFDIMVEAMPTVLTTGGGWVVLGTGDPWAAEQLRQLEKRFPGKVRFVQAFDAPLAQRIYAGSDIFIMPSSFEPCGLGQMFAMRYGNVPVVRNTGGLADTVFEGINGFVCQERTGPDLMAALFRAKKAYEDPRRWSQIMASGMNGDYSWDRSAAEYIKMFQEAVAARKEPARPAKRG